MRRYVIDELDDSEMGRLARGLRDMGLAGSIEGLYWLPVPEALLNDTQRAHTQTCGPYCVAVETTPDGVSMELLVRARNRLRCDCVAMADARVATGLMETLNALVERLAAPPADGQDGSQGTGPR